MFLEIGTGAVLAAVFLAAKTKEKGGASNDHKKIKEIADQCNLKTKNQSIRIHRKSKKENYTEYVYQIPLGLSFNDFVRHIDAFNDGLNNKTKVKNVEWKNWKRIEPKYMRGCSPKDIVQYIRAIMTEFHTPRKSVEMSYDGMLRIKVYEKDIPSYATFHSELWDGCLDWHIPLGEDKEGEVYLDVSKGHIVIAGATTFGKSQMIKLLISSLFHLHPDDVEFTLIDLKGGLEMQYFQDCEQVVDFAYDLEAAEKVLQNITVKIEERQELLRSKRVNNVCKAGIKKRHFIIVDEAGELAPSQNPSPKEAKLLAQQAQAHMAHITRIGHSMGYTLVYATQYPVGDIMPNQIKANSNTTICFRLETDTQSETVLDQKGAEQLQHQGRAILALPSGRKEVQTYLIQDQTIQKVIKPYINIRPRKEKQDEKSSSEGTKGREYPLIIEETRLS